MSEENKPEPRPSGQDDARRFLRLARLEPMSPCEAFLADAIEVLLRPKPEPQAMPDSVRAVIASRFRAGESVALLVNDYGRPTEQVEAAIRSEMPSVEEP